MSSPDRSSDIPEGETEAPAPPPASPPPPKGPSLKLLIGLAVVAAAMLGVGVQWGDAIKRGVERLVHVVAAGDETDETADSEDAGPQFFTCGMHPWVILPKPGECPICRMTLIRLDPAKFSGEVTIDPVVLQNIGVRIEEVKTGPVVRSIRTVGTVDYDETRVRDVNIKVSGWIERLHVDYEGAAVKRGQPLFDLYSRELYEAQEEYLLAYRAQDAPAVDFLQRTVKDARDLLESSRVRLELYDVTPEQIEDLETSGTPRKNVAIVSRHDGVVIEKNAYDGMQVQPGMRMYRIADLSRVWVMVTLYEFQLPYVSLGQRAVMTLPYIPGQVLEGDVTYIYPWLQKKVREVRVRLEFDNPDLVLKPGMYANIELRGTLAAERTLAPRPAIIDTGERAVAFVSLGDGRFEPRQVLTGVETDGGMVEVLDGLRPGEMVVTSGQFLIDSESKIREALAKMVRGDLASDQRARAAVAGRSELTSLPEPVAAGLVKVLEGSFSIGDRLAGDSTEGIDEPARELASAAGQLVDVPIPEDPHFWHRHDEVATVGGKARELVSESDLAGAREKFADLSVALSKLVKATGVPPAFGKQVEELRCPMYREGQGGSIWLQPEGEVRNPFFGSVMLSCFDRRVALPVTGATEGEATGTPVKAEQDVEPAVDHTHETEAAGAEETEEVKEPQPPDGASTAPGAQDAVDRVVAAYLELQEMLAGDRHEGVPAKLDAIRRGAAALSASAAGEVKSVAAEVSRALPAEGDADAGLGRLRVAFKNLSAAVIALVEKAPPSDRVAPQLFRAHCPMAKGSWLQKTKVIANPYYGASMLRCGEITGTVAARSEGAED